MSHQSDWSLLRDSWAETKQDSSNQLSLSRCSDAGPDITSRQHIGAAVGCHFPQIQSDGVQAQHVDPGPSVTGFHEIGAEHHHQPTYCAYQSCSLHRARVEEETNTSGSTVAFKSIEDHHSKHIFSSYTDVALFAAATAGFAPDLPVSGSPAGYHTWQWGQSHQSWEHMHAQQEPDYTTNTSYTDELPIQNHTLWSALPQMSVHEPQTQSCLFACPKTNDSRRRPEIESYPWRPHQEGHAPPPPPPPAIELLKHEKGQVEVQECNRLRAYGGQKSRRHDGAVGTSPVRTKLVTENCPYRRSRCISIMFPSQQPS